MIWDVTTEVDGKVVSTKHGNTIDPFVELAGNPKAPRARVSINVGHSEEYGALKCGVTVSVECEQKESIIDRAGEKAFYKALELLTDSWDALQSEAAKPR